MAYPIYSAPPSGPKLGKVHPTKPGARMMKTWEYRRDDEDDPKRVAVIEELLRRRKGHA